MKILGHEIGVGKTIFQAITIYLFTAAGGFIVGFLIGYAKGTGVDVTDLHASGATSYAMSIAVVMMLFLAALLLFLLQATNIFEVVAISVLLFVFSVPNLLIVSRPLLQFLIANGMMMLVLFVAKGLSVLLLKLKDHLTPHAGKAA